MSKLIDAYMIVFAVVFKMGSAVRGIGSGAGETTSWDAYMNLSRTVVHLCGDDEGELACEAAPRLKGKTRSEENVHRLLLGIGSPIGQVERADRGVEAKKQAAGINGIVGGGRIC